MADLEALLSVILNTALKKDERISAMGDVVQLLQQQDRLQEMLDLVNSRWVKLVGLLWQDSDTDVRKAESTMIAKMSTAAVQYARLSSSKIPPGILFLWIDPYLHNQSHSVQGRLRWDARVMFFMLNAVNVCLSDLEGSAFKGFAPGLLDGCLSMLSSKQTPIKLFGVILEILTELAKVPSCIWPKFQDIVDLLVGWGVCSDTQEQARPKLMKAFQSLKFGWEDHKDLAASLIKGMADDMQGILTSPLEPSQQSEFINTANCFVSILSSSAELVPMSVFDTTPQILDLFMKALSKFAPLKSRRMVSQFELELDGYTKALVSAIVTRGAYEQSEKVGNGGVPGVDLPPGLGEESGLTWARSLCVSILEVLNGTLRDVAYQQSLAGSVLMVHASVLRGLNMHADVVDLEEKLRWFYGEHNVCFSLRSCNSKRMVKPLKWIYNALQTWPSLTMKHYFIELLLSDLQHPSATNTTVRGKTHALPLTVPPSRLPTTQPHNRESSQTQTDHTMPIVSSSVKDGAMQELDYSTDAGVSKEKVRWARRVTFALAVFKKMVKTGTLVCSVAHRLWDVLSKGLLEGEGILMHPLVIAPSVSLLRMSGQVILKCDDQTVPAGFLECYLDTIAQMLRSKRAMANKQVVMIVLEWVQELKRQNVRGNAPLLALLFNCVQAGVASHDSVLRSASADTLDSILSTRERLTSQMLLNISTCISNGSMDVSGRVGCAFTNSIGPLASYCLQFANAALVSNRQGVSMAWSRIAFQPQQYLFRSGQLGSFLSSICQGAQCHSTNQVSALQLYRQDQRERSTWSTDHLEWVVNLMRMLPELNETVTEGEMGMFGNEACVKAEDLNSVQAMLWFVVHEAARNFVAARFRTHNNGPSQIFAGLDETLSGVKACLTEGKPIDVNQTWMLLEFIAALEKLSFCVYEGSDMRLSPSRAIWTFYTGNRRVFEEWFNRLRHKLLYVAHRIGHHRFASQLGMVRLQQLEQEYKIWSKDPVVHALVENVDDSGQKLKLMANARKGGKQNAGASANDPLSNLMKHLSEVVLQTTLSMCRMNESSQVTGIHRHVVDIFKDLLIPGSTEIPSATQTPVGWLTGLALQASGEFEAAISAYNEFYTYARSHDMVYSQNKQSGKVDDHHQLVIARTVVKEFQPFVRERIAECFNSTADWRGFGSFLRAMEQSRMTEGVWRKLKQIELSASFDSGVMSDCMEKMRNWTQQEKSPWGLDEISATCNVSTVRMLLTAKSSMLNKPDADVLEKMDQHSQALWPQLHLPVQILSSEEPDRLGAHLFDIYCLNCAEILAQGNAPNDDILTAFKICTPQPVCDIGVDMGMLGLLVPEVSGTGCGNVLYGLSAEAYVKLLRVQRAKNVDDQALYLFVAGAHAARRKGNVRLASRLLNDEVVQKQLGSSWERWIVLWENWEVLLHGARNETTGVLAQCWDSVAGKLAKLQSEDEPSKAVMGIILNRLSHCLDRQSSQADLDKALSVVNVNWSAILGHLKDHWPLVESMLGEEDWGMPGHRLTKIRAACTTAAVTLSPRLAVAWQDYADMLFTLAQESRTKSGSSILQTSHMLEGMRHALVAYCKALNLDGQNPHFAMMLRLYKILHCYGQALLGPDTNTALDSVPPIAWKSITPQLFVELGNSADVVRQCMLKILKGVASVALSCVLYPAVVEQRKAEVKGEPLMEELKSLLADLHCQHPQLFGDLSVMLDEMERITVLWVEEWHITLAELHLDVHRRMVTLQAEMDRLRTSKDLDQEQKSAMLTQRFATLMSPVIMTLEKRLRSTLLMGAETPHEVQFRDAFMEPLLKGIAALKEPKPPLDGSNMQEIWLPMKQVLKDMNKHLRVLQFQLNDLSPGLMQLKNTEIPMPGQQDGNVTISSFGQEILVLSTKTRPKKLEMVGSDGHSHTYLLKGREDLHLDQRLMQFLSAMNGVLERDSHTGTQGLRAHGYSVTPLGGRVGLIQWVSGTVSLYGLFRAWQKRKQERFQAATAARAEQDGDAGRRAGGDQFSAAMPIAAQMRPNDLFSRHMFPALQEAGLDRFTRRKDWPLEVVLKVFQSMKQQMPSRLLASEIWCGSSSSSTWWMRTGQYNQSMAVTSMVGFILGLGDRHLDNVLIDRNTAELVHIDYNVCFEKGLRLRVPEIVPFRLTQIMELALGVGGHKGKFRDTCLDVLRVIRENKAGLWLLLDAILNDPTVDWAAERNEKAARKGMDLAVSLQLFESRCEEMQRTIDLPRQTLLPILGEATNSCRVYLQVHKRTADLMDNMQMAGKQTADAQGVLATVAMEEQELVERMNAAGERQKKLLNDVQHVRTSVEKVLAHCDQWTYRHGRALSSVQDQIPVVMTTPQQNWNSKASNTSLELAIHSGKFPNPTILESVLGTTPSASVLPRDTLSRCKALDQQGGQLLPSRDDLVLGINKTMEEYINILKHVLPANYITTSDHYKWMQVFETALGSVGAAGAVLAAEFVPKVASDSEKICMWKALHTAYQTVETHIETVKKPTRVTPALLRVEQEAGTKCSAVQTGLSSEWDEQAILSGLQQFLQKIRQETSDMCKSLVEQDDVTSASFVMQMSSDPVTVWARTVFGMAQVFRLLKPSTVGKVLRYGWKGEEEGSPDRDTSTGFAWLDALEKLTSSFALAFRSCKMGPLVDITTFIEEGPVVQINGMLQTIEKQAQRLEGNSHQAWNLEKLKIEHADFIATYDTKVQDVVKGLQEINRIATFRTDLSGDALQELAGQQQILTNQLHELQIRWENLESVSTHLKQDSERLQQEMKLAVDEFKGVLDGSRQPAVVDQSDQAKESTEKGLPWGATDFPVCRGFAEFFELLESAEQKLSPYTDLMSDNPEANSQQSDNPSIQNLPPSFQRWTCHFEHALWMQQMLKTGLQKRQTETEECAIDIQSMLDSILLKGVAIRLQRTAGRVLEHELSALVGKLDAQVSDHNAGSNGPNGRDSSYGKEQTLVKFTDFGDVSGPLEELEGSLEQGSGASSVGKKKGLVKFTDFKGDGGDDLLEPLESMSLEPEETTIKKTTGPSDPAQTAVVLDSLWSCLEAQGLYAHSALLLHYNDACAETLKDSQSIRLRNLAAFEWLHDRLIEKAPVHSPPLYVREYLRSKNVEALPKQMLQEPMGRSETMTILKNAVEQLKRVQAAVSDWEDQSRSMGSELQKCIQAAVVRQHIPGADASMGIQVLQGYLNRRARWLTSSYEHTDALVALTHAVLQFEFSREGLLWTPGEAPSNQAFSDFSTWLQQMSEMGEGLQTVDVEVHECQALLLELQHRAEQATAVLTALQGEDAFVSQGLSESTGLIVQSAYEASQKLQGLGESIQKCQQAVQDIGSLLKELSSITTGHKSTSDVHQLVSSVLEEHSKLTEVLPKVVAVTPELSQKLYKHVEMVVKYQQQGMDADAAQLYQQAAASLVENEENVVVEIEGLGDLALQAGSSLSGIYQAFDSLIAAITSIAATLQSEHGFDDDSADIGLGDGQQTQNETQKLEQMLSQFGGSNAQDPSTIGQSKSIEEEQWVSVLGLSQKVPLQPTVIKADNATTKQPDSHPINTPYTSENQPTVHGKNDNDTSQAESGQQPGLNGHKEGAQVPSNSNWTAVNVNGNVNVNLNVNGIGNVHGNGHSVNGKGRRLLRGLQGVNQFKLTRQMSDEQRQFGLTVSRQCLGKLEGRRDEGGEAMTVEEQVDGLIAKARDPSNLCRMYEGWTAWI